ncbi:hypothetical protein EMIT0194MI4_40360 [Pseudomonas sp. IT-194MI4]
MGEPCLACAEYFLPWWLTPMHEAGAMHREARFIAFPYWTVG